ncbi:chromate transporter [Halalkalibacter oceani]|uniref:Chromate transporter n=1 Tax=Halalkalibacter oceani TaxID=1653776 RepID=A0A9X2IPH8_9BACI|nr:chromate transporter [Halalkalibacter oceani]MCM3714472.1 chromate transporter [Halalkalibacter oceani]
MIYLHIFLAFFIPNIVGYGGGPASVPLIQEEVVNRYGWMTVEEFAELLAIGNALPGPINTKLAGYIGYEMGGAFGSFVGLFATIAPSLLAMVFLLALLYKFRNSPRVKRMTGLIRPTITVLLGVLTWQFFGSSLQGAGLGHTMVLALGSWVLMEKVKIHPAYVIAGSLCYGALFLA